MLVITPGYIASIMYYSKMLILNSRSWRPKGWIWPPVFYRATTWPTDNHGQYWTDCIHKIRKRMVWLVSGITDQWRWTEVEIHEWWIGQWVGLEVHCVSHNASCCSNGHALRQETPLPSVHGPRHVSYGFPHGLFCQHVHRPSTGCCFGSLCSAQFFR